MATDTKQNYTREQKETLMQILETLPAPSIAKKRRGYIDQYKPFFKLILTFIRESNSRQAKGYISINPYTYVAFRLITECNWPEKAADQLQEQLITNKLIEV